MRKVDPIASVASHWCLCEEFGFRRCITRSIAAAGSTSNMGKPGGTMWSI